MAKIDRITVEFELDPKSLVRFTESINQAMREIKEFESHYIGLTGEKHAEWFATLPGWKRILWLMAHGAHLTRVGL